MEERRAGLAAEWHLRLVHVSLLLPAGPPYFFVLVLSTQEHRERALYILFSHPSAPRQDLCDPLLLLVLSPGKNVPLLPEQCYLTPYSVLPGL